METIQMSFSWWIDDENVVHIYYGLFRAAKRDEISNFTGKWMELEKIRLWGNSDLERQMTHVLSHLQKPFFSRFLGEDQKLREGGVYLKDKLCFAGKITGNRKGRGSMVVCLSLADSVGNERSRLSMGRWLKLLGLSNDAPFKKEEQRERKQDISHLRKRR